MQKKIREDKYIIPIEEIDKADIVKAKKYFCKGRELYNLYFEEWKKRRAEIEHSNEDIVTPSTHKSLLGSTKNG